MTNVQCCTQQIEGRTLQPSNQQCDLYLGARELFGKETGHHQGGEGEKDDETS